MDIKTLFNNFLKDNNLPENDPRIKLLLRRLYFYYSVKDSYDNTYLSTETKEYKNCISSIIQDCSDELNKHKEISISFYKSGKYKSSLEIFDNHGYLIRFLYE